MTLSREPDRELDGSSAGGQFLRTALGLAVLRNESIRIENVRGDRPKPGLRHQHLAVLETMAAVCDAEVSGAELGAETVAFDPTPASAEPDARPVWRAASTRSISTRRGVSPCCLMPSFHSRRFSSHRFA